MSHNKPYFNDAICNLTTSCTVEDAVQLLLGWRQEILEPLVEYDPETGHEEYMQDEDIYEESLEEKLQGLWGAVRANYDNLRFEQASMEDIFEAGRQLKNTELLIRQAHRYLCAIHDELAKKALSEIRIDTIRTTNNKNPYITFSSLHQWSLKTFEKPIFIELDEPDSSDSFKDLEHVADKSYDLQNQGEIRDLMILFGLLFRAFKNIMKNNNINHEFETDDAIYEVIINNLKSDQRCNRGFGNKTIAEFKLKCSDLSKIETSVKKSSWLDNRRLLIFYSLYAYLLYKEDFRTESGELDARNLAEHLKPLATELPELSAEQIEATINKVVQTCKPTTQ